MSDIHNEIGVIIGEASSSAFYFSSKPEQMPSRWEYVVVYSEEDARAQNEHMEATAHTRAGVAQTSNLNRWKRGGLLDDFADA